MGLVSYSAMPRPGESWKTVAFAGLFLEAQGVSSGRWFDKTPQNIYGLTLLSAVYPEAKFVCIVRHPLNVVASLKRGKVMAAHSF